MMSAARVHSASIMHLNTKLFSERDIKMEKIITLTIVFLVAGFLWAENMDPYEAGEQYGWSENTGWLNAEPNTGDGMHVESDKVTGFVWGENIGWINLHCENNGTCGTASYGVVNDGDGNLSGFGWGENVGWVNFDPDVPGDPDNKYKVSIDEDGKLSGWAWGENIGWIHFDDAETWSVRVCIVTLEDLQNFASYWLTTNPAANLDGTDPVNMGDFAIFASYWEDYCPDGWALK